MSVNGELILDRLPLNCELHNPNNPMRKIINNTVGAWLDDFEDKDWGSQFFLTTATGKYLDLHGNEWGIKRRRDEIDEHYRNRIIYESLGHVTVDLLLKIYNIKLYVKVDNFDIVHNTLTSDNKYISSYGFLAVANSDIRKILNKKFVVGANVEWVV